MNFLHFPLKGLWSMTFLIVICTTLSSNLRAQDCVTSPVITCPSIYFGCFGDDISPESLGFATAVPGDANCPQPIITYRDTTLRNNPCGDVIEIKRIWTATYPENTNPWLVAECTQVILLEDNDDPVIQNCPADITVNPGPNCRAIVSWTPPTATDDCGLLSFTSNFGSGSEFSVGTTTVTYTAVDHCGRTSSCSFTVTVIDDCCGDYPVLRLPPDFTGCTWKRYRPICYRQCHCIQE